MWRGLESAVFFATGVRAMPKPTYDDYKPIHTDLHADAKRACPRVIERHEVRKLKRLLQRHHQCKTSA